MAAAVGVLMLAMVTIGFFVARGQPVVSNTELEEARVRVTEADAEGRAITCDREPVFGDALTPEVTLSELVDSSGPFGTCFLEAGRGVVGDALFRPSAVPGRGTWNWDVPTFGPLVPFPPNFESQSPGLPFYRVGDEPALLTRARTTCDGLADWIEELARARTNCSPLRMAPVDLLTIAGGEIGSLSQAIAVVARGRGQSGDLQGALRLLVQGAAVLRDLRRGPVTLDVAMMGASAEGRIWSTLQNTLIQTERLDSPFAGQLTDALNALLASPPPLHPLLLGEALSKHAQGMLHARTNVEFRSDARMMQWMAAKDLDALDSWCPPGTSALDCVRPIPTLDEWPEFAATVLGERAVRSKTVTLISREWYVGLGAYLMRLHMTESLIHMAKLSVHLVEERAEGRCPTEAIIPAAMLESPGSTAPLEVTRLGGHEYQIIASPPSASRWGARLSQLFICPGPPSGRWVPEASD